MGEGGDLVTSQFRGPKPGDQQGDRCRGQITLQPLWPLEGESSLSLRDNKIPHGIPHQQICDQTHSRVFKNIQEPGELRTDSFRFVLEAEIHFRVFLSICFGVTELLTWYIMNFIPKSDSAFTTLSSTNFFFSVPGDPETGSGKDKPESASECDYL